MSGKIDDKNLELDVNVAEEYYESKVKSNLKRVSEETMRFMRGKYVLDEVGNGKDELKFRRGGKTILTIYIRNDRYDFLVIFGKAERECFERQRDEFCFAGAGIFVTTACRLFCFAGVGTSVTMAY